jgi:DNA adenine methylase
MKSPIKWWGGKYYQAAKIVALFPPHQCYVEAFGGAAHVLFKKSPSLIEVYNDINSNLVRFFSVLRDKDKAEELIRRLQLTPYSREEFKFCRDNQIADEIEAVRRWYVCLCQSFSCNEYSWSHSRTISCRGMSQAVSSWLSKVVERLPAAVERLRRVQIEQMDFRKLIHKYDSSATLFYLDPPYIHETRTMSFKYKYEMNSQDHEDLVRLLQCIKGKAVLSGYDNEMYRRLHWKRILLGNYPKWGENIKRQYGSEFVWINF